MSFTNAHVAAYCVNLILFEQNTLKETVLFSHRRRLEHERSLRNPACPRCRCRYAGSGSPRIDVHSQEADHEGANPEVQKPRQQPDRDPKSTVFPPSGYPARAPSATKRKRSGSAHGDDAAVAHIAR